MGERRGRGKSRNMNRGLMGRDNGVGIDCEKGVWGRGEQRGKRWDNCNWTTIIKKDLFILRGGKGGRKRGRETPVWERNIGSIASCMCLNDRRLNPKLRHGTISLFFAGWWPANWATLVRDQVVFLMTNFVTKMTWTYLINEPK